MWLPGKCHLGWEGGKHFWSEIFCLHWKKWMQTMDDFITFWQNTFKVDILRLSISKEVEEQHGKKKWKLVEESLRYMMQFKEWLPAPEEEERKGCPDQQRIADQQQGTFRENSTSQHFTPVGFFTWMWLLHRPFQQASRWRGFPKSPRLSSCSWASAKKLRNNMAKRSGNWWRKV